MPSSSPKDQGEAWFYTFYTQNVMQPARPL